MPHPTLDRLLQKLEVAFAITIVEINRASVIASGEDVKQPTRELLPNGSRHSGSRTPCLRFALRAETL